MLVPHFALLTLVGLAVGADLQAAFTYPVEKGLVFYQLDTVNVSYTSNIANATLWTFCWTGDSGNVLSTEKIINPAAPYNGSELIFINFNTNSNNCWFNLRDSTNQNGINSVGFTITSNQRSQTTLGLPGSAATTSAASSVSQSPTSSATKTESSTGTVSPSPATSSQTSSNGGDGGLSTGAKAGIGVGVSLGVIGVAALAAAVWLLRRRVRSTQYDGAPKTEEAYGGVAVPNKKGGRRLPTEAQEMAAQIPPQELPG